ncbi:hypothetical protein HAX54_035037 [Datura stramonium]|uniref:Uncharacterized protein n=1 Tax=Datura stramonium TaxID=4076 RepID=A0ABS8SF68_DATST|nr:hypothetical protein [Datura stramonium]
MGSFNEHIAALKRLGVIRRGGEIEQLQNVSSLIIPGGEHHHGQVGRAPQSGLIFLANKATGQKTGGQELIGGLDCTVHRNFFGSQIQSFETELPIPQIVAKEGGPSSFRDDFHPCPAILGCRTRRLKCWQTFTSQPLKLLIPILLFRKKRLNNTKFALLVTPLSTVAPDTVSGKDSAESGKKVLIVAKARELTSYCFSSRINCRYSMAQLFLEDGA